MWVCDQHQKLGLHQYDWKWCRGEMSLTSLHCVVCHEHLVTHWPTSLCLINIMLRLGQLGEVIQWHVVPRYVEMLTGQFCQGKVFVVFWSQQQLVAAWCLRSCPSMLAFKCQDFCSALCSGKYIYLTNHADWCRPARCSITQQSACSLLRGKVATCFRSAGAAGNGATWQYAYMCRPLAVVILWWKLWGVWAKLAYMLYAVCCNWYFIWLRPAWHNAAQKGVTV